MRPYLMVPVDQAVSKCGLENLDNIAGERTRVVHKTCGPAKVIVDIRWLPVQARFPLLSGQDDSLHRPRPRVCPDPAFTGSSHCASPNPLLSSLPQMVFVSEKMVARELHFVENAAWCEILSPHNFSRLPS